jgi:hypothetical protein
MSNYHRNANASTSQRAHNMWNIVPQWVNDGDEADQCEARLGLLRDAMLKVGRVCVAGEGGTFDDLAGK